MIPYLCPDRKCGPEWLRWPGRSLDDHRQHTEISRRGGPAWWYWLFAWCSCRPCAHAGFLRTKPFRRHGL